MYVSIRVGGSCNLKSYVSYNPCTHSGCCVVTSSGGVPPHEEGMADYTQMVVVATIVEHAVWVHNFFIYIISIITHAVQTGTKIYL